MGAMKRFVSCFLMLMSLSMSATAQSPGTVRAVVYEFLRGQSAGQNGQVKIEVEEPVIPANMPRCDQLEPWLPAGARPWGKVRVGVRCIGQGNWSLFVPAQVSILGNYLAAARALRPGDVLDIADIELRTGEITTMGRQLLTEPEQALGQQMRFAVAVGQPLRATMMSAPIVIQSGRPVKVVVQGAGFSVANQRTALGSARAGQAIRVRLASGKVVSGTATQHGEVIIRP